jgi:hypothetical protein
MPSQVVRVDALRTLAAGGISGTYAPIGTVFNHPMRLFKIINTCNADVTISFDGVTDNDYVPAGSFVLYDCTTNKVLPDTTFVFANGTQVFAKGTVATGAVYVVVIFGQGD